MVEILKSGLYDSIQDLGRNGYQAYGVPISGAMDHYASQLANSILGNRPNDAVLEFTLMAPKLKFHTDTAICLTGMESRAQLNAKRIENNSYVTVKRNDVLSFGSKIIGTRGYMAVLGGFQTEKLMGSRSFYHPVTVHNRLKTGDRLPILSRDVKPELSHAVVKTPQHHFITTEIDVFKGAEYHLLQNDQRDCLLSSTFTISKESNRMAYQMEERVENTLSPIITAPVLPGTVQLTPSGQCMVLLRDCQTTGGYPRILQLSEMAMNQLSQKMAGQTFRFRLINFKD